MRLKLEIALECETLQQMRQAVGQAYNIVHGFEIDESRSIKRSLPVTRQLEAFRQRVGALVISEAAEE